MTAPAQVEAARALGAATLGETGGDPMLPRIGPVWPGAQVAGPAFPVRCGPGDNLAIHVAVTLAPAGSVLVVDAHAVPDRGYWGEVLTTAAIARALAGLVIDGGVRDVAAIERRGFPVFAAMIALPGAQKVAGGSVELPVTVGGVEVSMGDLVIADRDGVTVVAAPHIDAALEAGASRAQREEGLFASLAAGATTVELLGLDPAAVRRAAPPG